MSVDRFGSGRFMVWRGAHDAVKANLIMIRQTLNAQRPIVFILQYNLQKKVI
jgi:hypothetical protein